MMPPPPVYPQPPVLPPVHAVPAPPPAASAEPDVYEQLRKLGELRDLGVVTADEFEQKKRELLARI